MVYWLFCFPPELRPLLMAALLLKQSSPLQVIRQVHPSSIVSCTIGHPVCPTRHSRSPYLPLVPQDSSTSKLLYNKEVQGYKAQVKNYYEEVRELPRIPEDAMQYYLKQLSVVSHVMCVCVASFPGCCQTVCQQEKLQYVRYTCVA